MYRQILVFSDAQGKSITWRLSVKKNIPAPEGLAYTGRVLVRCVGGYGDNGVLWQNLSTRKSRNGKPSARKSYLWRWNGNTKMTLEKAWGSTWSIGPQPVSNEALAENWIETRLWPLNPEAVKSSMKKLSIRGDSGPSIRISWDEKLRPKQKWFKSTPSEGIFLPSVLKWDERNGGRSGGLPEDAWGDLIR